MACIELNKVISTFARLVKEYDNLRTWQQVEQILKDIEPGDIVECRYWIFGDKHFSKARMLREWYETATMIKGIEIMNKYPHGSIAAYKSLVELYNRQIKLRRTSQNQKLEQFSTPLPIAYLLGWWTYNAAVDNKTIKTVVDPTGGNGLLLTYFFHSEVFPNVELYLNDLDALRSFDAAIFLGLFKRYGIDHFQDDFYSFINHYPRESATYLLINPPFSRAKTPVTVQDQNNTYRFYSQDFAMVATALKKLLSDSGRAACIIGGHTFGEITPTTYWDRKGRPKAGEERDFWFYLYQNYNVVDVIYIDGKRLWAKQGQETNLRIILIDGKRARTNTDILPPLHNPQWDKLVNSWDELMLRIEKTGYNLYQMIKDKTNGDI